MTSRVLIVEDSRVQAVFLKRLMEKRGCEVLVAVDGEQGLDMARREQPGLIISDVKMPKMDGFEMCRALKADPATCAIPVLMLTELSDPHDIVRGLGAGADNYLTKPYDDETLFEKASALLDRPTPDLGLEQELTISFLGEQHVVRTGPYRVLNLLLSTYESAVQKNRELLETQSALKELNDKLENMAFFDSLTGLPNRRLFLNRLDQAISHVERYGSRFAVLALDLDRFKQVNDQMGHDVGDLLLIQVAIRLQEVLRTSDTTARFGGDEFSVLLPSIGDDRDVLAVADKIIDAVSQPYRIQEQICDIGVSIGIACFPDHADSRTVLLKRADLALYEAKNGGRNRHCVATLSDA